MRTFSSFDCRKKFSLRFFYFSREAMSKVQHPNERKPQGPRSQRPPFTWEEICMYLYGHTAVETAIPGDQRKIIKREENNPGTNLRSIPSGILNTIKKNFLF